MMKKVFVLFMLLTTFIFPMTAQVAESAPIDKARIQIVDYFEDFKVKIVKRGGDYRIRLVNHRPFSRGEWQIVEHFADYKIKFVEHFEDFTVEFIN